MSHTAAPELASHSQLTILGIDVDHVDNSDVLAFLDRWVLEKGSRTARQVCTVNPEFLVDAQRDAAFRRVLEEADLRVADGAGVMLASRVLGAPLPERVTGSDGLVRIAERAARRGWRLYLLGAGPGVAERAATRLAADFPGLQVAGCYPGSPDAREWPTIIRRLRTVRPDILFVAFGHPRQDFWIWSHRADLPCAVAIGVGGAFDYVAGETRRAPLWMRNLGLEWLFRLVTQPWRWRRMLKLPLFVGLVAQQLIQADTQRRKVKRARAL